VNNSLKGFFQIMSYQGIRSIFLGFLHIMLDTNDNNGVYKNDNMIWFFAFETIFMLQYIWLIFLKDIFKIKASSFIEIFGCLLRLSIIFSFYVDKNSE
jgi:hypothetical protein